VRCDYQDKLDRQCDVGRSFSGKSRDGIYRKELAVHAELRRWDKNIVDFDLERFSTFNDFDHGRLTDLFCNFKCFISMKYFRYLTTTSFRNESFNFPFIKRWWNP